MGLIVPRSRFLVITRAGRASLHPSWIGSSEDRNFDLLISWYEGDSIPDNGIGLWHEFRPGRKVEGYSAILKDHAEAIAQYDHVALFDDDISVLPGDISSLFEIAAERNLKICQPSLTHDSYFSYAGVLRARAFSVRYVTYIEMMCPIFRSDVLLHLAPLFGIGLESGLDLIWCNATFSTSRDFAVIDRISVRHTRRVGRLKHMNGFANGKRYGDDIQRALATFDIPFVDLIPYGGELRSGRIVTGRIELFLRSMTIIPAIWRIGRMRSRLRPVLVYLRNILFREARNIPISDWQVRC